ncbi:UNVERIFIED_CONTAM: ArsI/CadI family heavy metal resistance metalloenzyme [Kocuria sp. CPCC 205316]|uniref:ArsI/CadI family heavy metal resistance metalloenzyme n=1 Tax=Kocuria TaxID=57493 RepID=UPI0036DA6814
MSRVQLALRVADLEASITFYSTLFNTTPAKRRPGYANFAITEPPLKLVLLEGEPGEETRMDHLGVEVESTEVVNAAAHRLADAGLATRPEEETTCCYAVQDKVWVTGPGQEPWEVYTVKADARPDLEGQTDPEQSAVAGDGTCCTTDDRSAPADAGEQTTKQPSCC